MRSWSPEHNENSLAPVEGNGGPGTDATGQAGGGSTTKVGRTSAPQAIPFQTTPDHIESAIKTAQRSAASVSDWLLWVRNLTGRNPEYQRVNLLASEGLRIVELELDRVTEKILQAVAVMGGKEEW